MIKLNIRRIPRLFKSFFIVDPLILENTKSEDISLWEYTMNRIYIQGVSKTTNFNRLKESSKIINTLTNKDEPICFLDIGASDASTSYYTHNFLKNHEKNITTYSADKYIQINYFKAHTLTYYFTDDQVPFLCKIFNIFSIQLYTHRHKDLISKYFARILIKKFNIYVEEYKSEQITLLNPIVEISRDFNYILMDVFDYNEQLKDKFDVVRCSNLLQTGYFSRDEIKIAIDIIIKYLKKNGILIISKTPGEKNFESGVVLQKHNNSLRLINKFNDGSLENFV